MLGTNLGNTIPITWQDHSGNKITRELSIPKNVGPVGRPVLGVQLGPLPVQALEMYKRSFTAGIIPILPPPTGTKGICSILRSNVPKLLFHGIWFVLSHYCEYALLVVVY